MDFIAVDFETPNSKNDCACSMGITLVKNSSILWSRNVLINPHARFDERNVSIHGISRNMVKDSPSFEEVWAEYGCFFRHYAIVMHNAAFDSSVLKKAAKRAHIDLPAMDFYCTMRLCAENYNFDKPTLSRLCDHFGLCLDHHNSGSDSLNTAKIMLLLLDDDNTCIHSYSSCSAMPAPSSPSVSNDQKTHRSVYFRPSSDRKLFQPVCNYDASPIEIPGKCFVFTGEIPGVERSEAIAFIEENGGTVSRSVSKKIDYLVIGLEDAAIVGPDGKSTKITRAEELIACGADIKLIPEEEIRLFLSPTNDSEALLRTAIDLAGRYLRHEVSISYVILELDTINLKLGHNELGNLLSQFMLEELNPGNSDIPLAIDELLFLLQTQSLPDSQALEM